MSELREYSPALTQYFLITWSHFILFYPIKCAKGGLTHKVDLYGVFFGTQFTQEHWKG